LTEQYRVPKREVIAEVVLFGQPPASMTIFLGERAETHSGYERPSDLLNGAGAFIPAAEKKGGLVLLRRDAVTILSVPDSDELGGGDPRAEELAADQATMLQVEIVLEDGSKVGGSLVYLMPEGERRLQDFLNLPDGFLVLRDRGKVRLVNKNRIARITTVGPR
jgi:hypothetical protein